MAKNTYEVLIPFHQYLHYTVEADSPAEALRLVESGYDSKGEQLQEQCSTGCPAGAKPKVKLIQKAEGK